MATCYQVAGGGEHTLIALDTGDVYSCGKGIDGQLGNATELFQIHLEDVVKLKNAMTRTWKPDGSNTTFNVANLFDVLEKLTMQQLLLSYQPAS